MRPLRPLHALAHLPAAVLVLSPALAAAHPGHGAAAWHVHTGKAAGWLALAALVVMAVWFGRRR